MVEYMYLHDMYNVYVYILFNFYVCSFCAKSDHYIFFYTPELYICIIDSKLLSNIHIIDLQIEIEYNFCFYLAYTIY